MDIPNVGPYFSQRINDIIRAKNNKQLINKFKNMDQVELKMYLELIFLNPRRKECVNDKYEIRDINRYAYNSTLDLLRSQNIGQKIQKMKARKKTTCKK